MKNVLVFLFLGILHSSLLGQSPFAPFKDGIYYTHETLQDNAPSISFDSIRQTHQSLEVKVDSKTYHPHRIKKLQIKAGRNRPIKIDVETIWALCYNGVLYIRGGKELIRIMKVGAICHFALEKIRFRLTDIAIGQLSDQRPRGELNIEEKKHRSRQFVLDFKTGEILPFESGFLNDIFRRDPPLHDYFEQEAEKEKVLFQYMLEYNKRHPIF